ncbi:Thioredoxin domain [Trinorchestia longiramus]|nr:Thioredoxin domain [Trinorchestia longiramus]
MSVMLVFICCPLHQITYWCGHCKRAKPEVTSAAAHFKDDPKVELAAVDCTSEQGLCGQYSVTSYPTFRYFNYFKHSQPYTGGRTEADFIAFLNDPESPATPPPPADASKTPAEEWGSLDGSDALLHLSSHDFHSSLQDKRALVLFYAPWCRHCKSMKADYALAAGELASAGNVAGHLATVDATQERSLAAQYDVKGFPTLLYFVNGEKVADYQGMRSQQDLITFMNEKYALAQKTEL